MVKVEVTPRGDVLAGGCSVPLARRGATWSETALGKHAKDQGVYVIHHGGIVKYVGKTDGPSMSFGMRLRREFQETASQGRHIYPKLAGLRVPPDITVYLFPAEVIRSLVSASDVKLTDAARIAILETVLVQVYRPEFQT